MYLPAVENLMWHPLAMAGSLHTRLLGFDTTQFVLSHWFINTSALITLKPSTIWPTGIKGKKTKSGEPVQLQI